MPLGNLVADALKAGTGAQIALTNGGGLRADLKEGNVTVRDIVAVLPFGNYGVTKYVTPAQLKEILENGIATAPAAAGKFPQIAGFTFAYDLDAPAGGRVTAITVGGSPVSLTDTATKILIATNDFMAVGGDEYTTFAAIKTENEFNALDEMLLDFIKANPDKAYTQAEGRIAVSAVAKPPEPPSVAEKPGETETPAKPVSPGAQSAIVVNCYWVNVRAGSGNSFSVIKALAAGSGVSVRDTQGGWYLVSDGKTEGWIYGAYLNVA